MPTKEPLFHEERGALLRWCLDAEANAHLPDHHVISLAAIDDKRGWSIYPKSYRTL